MTPAIRSRTWRAAVDANRLAAHHVRARRVVNVQQEAGRPLGPVEKRADRRAQRLLVARDDQHRHRLALVARGADNEMPQDAAQRGSRRRDARARKVRVQRKRDAVRAFGVNGALDDRDDAGGARRRSGRW